MKKIDALKPTKIRIDSDLDIYDKMPLFQDTMDKVGAVLEKKSTQDLIKEIKNERIKYRFEQNMSIEQIAQTLELPNAEVLAALEEMGLIEPVIG
jgi:hypothetical protein